LHISKADNSFYIGSSTRGGSFVPQNNGTTNISYFSMRFDDNGIADSIRLFNNYAGAGYGQGVAMYGSGDKVMGSLQMIQTDTSNTQAKFVINLRNGDASALKMTMLGTGATTFVSNITATAFFESSDFRLKKLIEHNPIVTGIENLQAKLYEKDGKIELGYFAQDAELIMPYAVTKNADGFLNLSYREVHTAKIARLEKEVAELKAQLNLN
jgi:hypothetical protein